MLLAYLMLHGVKVVGALTMIHAPFFVSGKKDLDVEKHNAQFLVVVHFHSRW